MNEPKATPPLSDPLIDEVRQRRRDLFAACGNDIQKLAEAIRRLESEHPELVADPRAKNTARAPAPGGGE